MIKMIENKSGSPKIKPFFKVTGFPVTGKIDNWLQSAIRTVAGYRLAGYRLPGTGYRGSNLLHINYRRAFRIKGAATGNWS